MSTYPLDAVRSVTQRAAQAGRPWLESLAAALGRATDALILGAVWAVLSLGVVTLLPATAASVRTVTAWMHDEPTSWRTYWEVFRRSLLPSLVITPGVVIAALALINSGLLAKAAPGGPVVEWMVWGSLACTSAVFVTTCVWVAPVMADRRQGPLQIVRAAWARSVQAPFASLVCAFALAIAAVIVAFWPPLIVFIVTPICWLVIRTTDRQLVARKG